MKKRKTLKTRKTKTDQRLNEQNTEKEEEEKKKERKQSDTLTCTREGGRRGAFLPKRGEGGGREDLL